MCTRNRWSNAAAGIADGLFGGARLRMAACCRGHGGPESVHRSRPDRCAEAAGVSGPADTQCRLRYGPRNHRASSTSVREHARPERAFPPGTQLVDSTPCPATAVPCRATGCKPNPCGWCNTTAYHASCTPMRLQARGAVLGAIALHGAISACQKAGRAHAMLQHRHRLDLLPLRTRHQNTLTLPQSRQARPCRGRERTDSHETHHEDCSW